MKDSPLPPPAANWFIDDSAFKDPLKKAGYAIVTSRRITEFRPLQPGTTSQQAKLIALTRALILVQDQLINIYTDFKYSFHIIYSHIPIRKERGYLILKNSPIINQTLILQLFQAAQLPKQVAVIQSNKDPISEGNNRADLEAKK